MICTLAYNLNDMQLFSGSKDLLRHKVDKINKRPQFASCILLSAVEMSRSSYIYAAVRMHELGR